MDNLKEERLKILELLKDGLITPADASNLLDALGSSVNELEIKNKQLKHDAFKMLRIKIDTEDGEKVRVNIPIEFAKLLKNGKFGNVNLDEMNVDLDAIIEMISNGASGELVSIVDEDGNTVSIVVE